MGGVTAVCSIVSIAVCLVVWRAGMLQATVMLPLLVVRGVLSLLKPAEDGVDPFSIAGGVLNVTKDHTQVAQNPASFATATFLVPACHRAVISCRSPEISCSPENWLVLRQNYMAGF